MKNECFEVFAQRTAHIDKHRGRESLMPIECIEYIHLLQAKLLPPCVAAVKATVRNPRWSRSNMGGYAKIFGRVY